VKRRTFIAGVAATVAAPSFAALSVAELPQLIFNGHHIDCEWQFEQGA
jgi:hypothetical protein